MDLQKNLLVVALAVVGYLLILQWNQDYNQPVQDTKNTPLAEQFNDTESNLADTGSNLSEDIPSVNSHMDVAPKSNFTISSKNIISVNTDVLNVKIDLKGGDIVFVNLPKYPKNKDIENQLFTLLEKNKNRYFIAQSGLLGENGIDVQGKERPLYHSQKSSYSLSDDGSPLIVNLEIKQKGAKITKRFTFTRASYEVKVDYLVHNYATTSWKGNLFAQLKRDNSIDPSKEDSAGGSAVRAYLGAAIKTNDKAYSKKDFGDFENSPFKETVKGGYAAILQHYFVSAWIPNQEEKFTYSVRESRDNTGNRFNIVGFTQPNALVVPPGQTKEVGATLYVGPKVQSTLAALADGLDLTIDYGILWFFAKPLFLLLQFLHSLFNNWGWSIIGLTVIVKLLFYPLSAASYRSMARMRRISPQLQSLKERYGDDRQKMSMEMMALYKKEKVNPMGGCLPILIQMPVFLSLYWVLAESVELRQAPWMGWIQDLSQMDPYFILPLVMGASMFAQQLLSPVSPDPIQARVMKLMPVIFTVFFLWFPSGLVLYWLVNNVLSILQQWYITKKVESSNNSATPVKA